jgi:hypothetical protein
MDLYLQASQRSASQGGLCLRGQAPSQVLPCRPSLQHLQHRLEMLHLVQQRTCLCPRPHMLRTQPYGAVLLKKR